MRLLDRFDRIRIINLPDRTDRRRDMDRELEKVGLAQDARVAYFAAIRPEQAENFTSVGARGVYLSQRQLLDDAAAAGESLLILEDDCRFTPAAKTFADGGDWDIFYGGYDASDPANLADSDIIGAHMMGFSKDGVRAASAYLEILKPVDHIHPPIDAAYVWMRRANRELKTTFANPPLAVQRTSRSDIAAPKWHHQLPFGRQLGGMVRRFLRY